MTRRDLVLFAAFTAALGALLAPALASGARVFSNFGDVYAYHFPLRHLSVGALQSGRLPFWNAYIFGGLPLLANSQAALFYPPSAALRAFATLSALDWEQAFHLWWAGLGLALLARRSGLRSLEAWLLGAVYALSPMLVYRLAEGIPTLLGSLAWAPWCWLAWLSGRRGWLGAAWALQFLAGHPQFLIANAAAMGVAALLQRERLAAARALAGEGLLALALAAAQWLPTWEFLARSVRASWPAAYSLGYSVGLSEAAAMLAPAPFGDPLAKTWVGPPSVFFETHVLYLGALVPALAALGLLRGRRALPLALIALGLFFAAGAHNPLYGALLETTALGFLRTPARWLFCCVFGLLLAAGAGLRALRGEGPSSWWRLALALALVGELASWDARFLRADDARPYVAAVEGLKARIGAAPHRVLTDPALANPNKTILYRAMNVNGYEAFYLDGFAAYAARSEGGPAADASRSYLSKLDTPEMARLAVLYKIRADGGLESAKRALPLAYAVDASERPLKAKLEIAREREERWRVSGVWPHGASKLVLSQPWYPGWSASFDGAPARLERWDGFLQALVSARPPAAGAAFSVEASFAPTGWALWAAVSVAAWLALAALARGKA